MRVGSAVELGEERRPRVPVTGGMTPLRFPYYPFATSSHDLSRNGWPTALHPGRVSVD